MQPPILPIQHSDVQWALYASTQPVKSAPTPEPAAAESASLLPVNLLIVVFVFGAFGAIVYKKRRADHLHQRIRRLEKLWQLESHSPFEEHQ